MTSAVVARESALRQRIITAAIEVTVHSGWSSVTMAGIAEHVGVSRQTVYNEVGSKTALAEMMVLDELAGFLTVVNGAFDEHPGDPAAAIGIAVRRVLERAQDYTLLHAIVSATYGADTELLPLLTTQSEGLLDAAKDVLRGRLAPAVDGIDAHDLDAIVDVVVRVVLSHVMRPSGTPLRTGEDIGRLSGVLLRRRA
jgi:AcrR family transcriptional regulator